MWFQNIVKGNLTNPIKRNKKLLTCPSFSVFIINRPYHIKNFKHAQQIRLRGMDSLTFTKSMGISEQKTTKYAK